MTLTSIARLRWLMPQGNLSGSSRKEIFRDSVGKFYNEDVCCVYSVESRHRGEYNVYTQLTITLKIEDINKLFPFASWPGAKP